MRARYYNAEQGRFTQQDGWEYANPEDPLSLNLYTYCWNNPIIFIDPNGNMWKVVPALDPRTRLYGGGSSNSDGRSHAAAYESSAYNTYRIKSTTALYDAQLGGYHSNNLSSGITNPSAYIVPGAETVTDDMAVLPQPIKEKPIVTNEGKNLQVEQKIKYCQILMHMVLILYLKGILLLEG